MAKRVQYSLEYPVKCSPTILFEFLFTPAGLGEWFADKVEQKDNTFHFYWKGSVEEAEMIAAEHDEYVVFRWDWMGKDEYFEFRIEKSPITNETILMIYDFAEKNDIKDQTQLWDTQVHELKHRIGS